MLSPTSICGFLTLAVFLFSPIKANAQNEISKRAKAVLEKHCVACHNGDYGENGFSFVLQQPRLVAKKYVTPGNLKDSPLYQRISKEEMPPGDVKQRPSKEDVVIIREWIEAGAPDFNPPVPEREIVTPSKMLELMLADLNTFNPRDQKFIRYYTLTHLSNAGFSDEELQNYRNALSKLINSLSWGRDIVVPKAIKNDPTKSILRINLNDYDWDEKTWESIVAANPYGVVYATEVARKCSQQVGCNLPYVRGDWFVHAAARPPLYHTILKLPKTDKELETQLRIDVAENIRKELVRRAGFNGSGVSQNNRLLEWHRTGYGAYWKSYDFAGKVDRKNLFQHPLGPGDAKELFQHDGGEIIFSLPNKLQAYMLIDGKGQRIDRGPLNVVSDPKQKDRTVVNGISCMSCHAQGMLNKVDQVREAALKAKNSYTVNELTTILRLYPEKKEFDDKLSESAKLFKEAVEKTFFREAVENSGTKLSTTEPIFVLSRRFEDEVDLKLAAAELGVHPDDFLKGLGKAPAAINRAFSTLRLDGGTVQRDVLVTAFGELIRVMDLGKFQPPEFQLDASTFISKTTGMQFVRVPQGTFKMGSPASEKGEKDRANDEVLHEVTITKDYFLGMHAVTRGQFRKFVEDTPGYKTEGEADKTGGVGWDATKSTFLKDAKYTWKDPGFPQAESHPVVLVSWNDAVAFCNWLSRQDGLPESYQKVKEAWELVPNPRGYRLPTEAEWERACRGGVEKQTRYFFGDDEEDLAKYANVADENYRKATGAVDGIKAADGYGFTAPVGQFKPNAYGLFDMLGNVSQWCNDWYGDYQDKALDPLGPQTGSVRVCRGGGWCVGGRGSRLAFRGRGSPEAGLCVVGFRVALVPSGQ